jgi:hypothetical protein
MNKTWGDIFKDQTLIIAIIIMFQFFALILIFAFYKTGMNDQAKSIILQTYVIAFTAAWGYFIGSSVAPLPPSLQKKEEPPSETPSKEVH